LKKKIPGKTIKKRKPRGGGGLATRESKPEGDKRKKKKEKKTVRMATRDNSERLMSTGSSKGRKGLVGSKAERKIAEKQRKGGLESLSGGLGRVLGHIPEQGQRNRDSEDPGIDKKRGRGRRFS